MSGFLFVIRECSRSYPTEEQAKKYAGKNTESKVK